MARAAVLQLAQGTIVIAALHHAQDAVEVARARDRALLAVGAPSHDRREPADQQRHERHAHGEIAAGPLSQRAGAQPSHEAEQTGARQTDRIFAELVNMRGAMQRHKHAAQRAAGRDGQVERREISRRWTRSRQLPMAQHAHDEQRRQIDRELQPHRKPDRRGLAACKPPGAAIPAATANSVRR